MRIAVLALQGAFVEHEERLRELEVGCFEVRQLADWEQAKDGLIIPGGESTAQIKLLTDLGLMGAIRESIRGGLPVFGTCAGLILLATHVEGGKGEGLATMDMTARRNAYGRQLGSFHTVAPVEGVGQDVPMTFIRAPFIDKVEGTTQVLATVDGHIVVARQDNQLATAFHPELDADVRMHEYFLGMVNGVERINSYKV